MKRFGYAIRVGGDPEISGALADGIRKGTPGKPKRRREGKEHRHANTPDEAVRRVAMWQHSPEEWEAMTIRARYDYGQDPQMPCWAECLLMGWALLWLGVWWLFDQQQKVLK